MTPTLRRLAALALVTSMAACGAPAEGPEGSAPLGGKADEGGGAGAGELPSVCVGVRGNGQKIFGHFGALARIHEHYGLISGIAGGSSGSITSFLTESIYANEDVFFCGDDVCSDRASAGRAALMYKSLQGYAQVVGDSDEVSAIGALAPVVSRLEAQGIDDLIANGDTDQARELLTAALDLPDVRPLINPEVLALLSESPDPAFHVQDVWEGVSGLGAFAVESDVILVRPGVVDFTAFARVIGRVGTFYAGWGPAEEGAWAGFLDACAAPARGLTWAEIARLEAGDTTCGAMFAEMATSWREQLLADEGSYRSRVDENVGAHLPALVSTSVITGDSVDAWGAARRDYAAARDYDLGVSYDDVRFGYWGRAEDLERVGANPNGYGDLKTSKFLALGERPYAEALSLSPAEPGLARALEIGPGLVSAGGWSDLSPALVLKNLGCDQVITVTREGATVGFDAAISRLLGMDDAQNDALFVSDADSAVRASLEAADGVWCTRWDAIPTQDIAGVFSDAYGAPLETSSEFLTSSDEAYPNVYRELGTLGCTPGVSE